jgi:hypothetical protein
MKLFYAPGSSSLLPHIVLYEAGLPFTAAKINEQTKVIEGGGDYRKVNPLGYVPALVLDDGTLLHKNEVMALSGALIIRRDHGDANMHRVHDLAPRLGVKPIGELVQPLVQSAPKLNAGGNR